MILLQRKKILEIIEKSDEGNQEVSDSLKPIPNFLKRQIYFRPSTRVEPDLNQKIAAEKKEKKPQKMTKSELKNTIDQSFTEIDKIKVGAKHPDPKKSNLTAKKVYDVVPMEGLSNINFVEYLFSNDPNKDFKDEEVRASRCSLASFDGWTGMGI